MFGWGGNGDDGKWEMKNGDENVIFPLFGWNKKEDERKGHNFFFSSNYKEKRKENGTKKKSKNQLHFSVTLLLYHCKSRNQS